MTPQPQDGVMPSPTSIPLPDAPAPSPAQTRVSFHPDDLPDNPLGPGECIVWFEGEYIDLFDWPEFRTDAPDPSETSPAETPAAAPARPINVSAVPLSAFKTRFEKIPAATYTLGDWLAAVRDGEMAKSVTAIRGSRGTPRYDQLKKKLPCIAFAGTFPQGRAGKFPTDASSLVFLEVDHHDGAPPPGWLESEKARLSANPAVVTVYVSAGGGGIHAVVAVDPVPVDRQSYRQAWAWATRELALEDRGDPLVKDSTRARLHLPRPQPVRQPNTHAFALGAQHACQYRQKGTGQQQAVHPRRSGPELPAGCGPLWC